MNIEITSASHKEQRASDVAAAVSVITQEDIRRSGMTTVPELLRLVPGVQVAQINSNKWAVAVRGFNNLFGRQAAGAHRWPHRVRPAQLRALLGIAGHPARPDRTHRSGPRAGRRDVGRQRGQRRDQHRHEIGGRPAGRRGQRRRRHARRRARGGAIRRDAGRRRVPRVFAMVGPRAVADRRDDAGQRQLAEPDARISPRLERRPRRGHGRRWCDAPKAACVVSRAIRSGAGGQTSIARLVVHARIQRPRPLDASPRQRRVAAGAVLDRLSPQRRPGQSHADAGRHRCAVSHGGWGRHDVVVGAGYRLVDENVTGGFSFSIAPNQVD